ncbi:MAG: DUF642 domain-containing protein [Opitutaceae bacterium]|jgi:hypothetical protein
MKMNTLAQPLILTVIVLTAALSSKAQTLLTNGGFESPGLASPTNFFPGPWTSVLPNGSTAVTGWVSVDNVPSGTAGADNVYCRAPYYGSAASEGEHFIYIDNNNYASPSLNGIYQDFSSLPGQNYQVTFDASTELGGSAGALAASAGGVTVHFTLPNSGLPPVSGPPWTPFPGWFNYSFTFTANASTTRLQFYDEGFQIGGDPLLGNASPLLDNVVVTAVPEPSSYAVLAGLCGLCFAAYRRRKVC